MTVKLNPPSSAVVVTVADEVAEKYLSAGWTKAQAKPKPARTEEKKAEEAPARRRPSRSQ